MAVLVNIVALNVIILLLNSCKSTLTAAKGMLVPSPLMLNVRSL
jgi:hypothetical protein